MKLGSTFILKSAIAVIGFAVIAFCTLVLPEGIRTTHVGGYRPILIGMYFPAIPFFIALLQGLKLLHYIDMNKAFSSLSTRSLRIIKYCAALICLMYSAGMPYIFHVADLDDAPGVVLIGLVIVAGSFITATAAGLFETLFQNALDLKSENDLTV